MSNLNFVYSHEKELLIANSQKERLKTVNVNFDFTHLSQPAADDKIYSSISELEKEWAKENLVVRDSKEALPELLNTKEFNLSEEPDKGHPESGEQFFRHLIRKYYRDHGPFTFEDFLKSIS